MNRIILIFLVVFFIGCNNSSKHKQEAIDLNNQALLLSQNSQQDSALILFDKAIKMDDKYYLPHANKIGLYLEKKEYEKALHESEMVNLKQPNLGEGWFFTGLLNKYVGKINEAKKCFEKSITIFSERINDPEKVKDIQANIVNRAIAKKFIEDESYLLDFNSLNNYEDYGDLNGLVDIYKNMTQDEIMNELLK